MFRRVPLIAILLVLCASVATADSWPTFQHDNYRSGMTGEQLAVEKLGAAWVYEAHQAPQPAWPAPAKWDAYAGIRGLRSMRNFDPVYHTTIAAGRLYYGSSTDDAVHCIDTSTGDEEWVYFTDGPVRVPPTIVEDRIYFGSDDGHAYCLDAGSGELVWKYRPVEPSRLLLNNGRSIPARPCRTGVMIKGDTAYFACALLPWKSAYLCAVDRETGQPEGEGRFVKEFRGVTMEGALLTAEDRLFVPQGRVPPLVFRRTNGHRLGTLKGGGGCFVLVTPDSHVLHGPGNKTGWITDSDADKRTTIATYKDATSMIVVGDIAYLLTDESLLALDRKTRKELWKREANEPFAMVYAAGTLLAGGDNRVAAYSAEDGEPIWSGAVDGRAYGLAVADGGLFVSTDEGRIHCFRAGETNDDSRFVAVAEEAEADWQPIPEIDDDALIGRWVFRPDQLEGDTVADLAQTQDGKLFGPVRLDQRKDLPSIALGGDTSVSIAEDHNDAILPAESLTAEAWVRVDLPMPWGGVIGAVQDNGEEEFGWWLGYREMRFCFAVRGSEGPAKLSYVMAPADYEVGRWYHLAATYDGEQSRLFINGQLVASGDKQRGTIAYPEKTFVEIGAFHDSDEWFRMRGGLHEVRLWRRALSDEEVINHFEQQPAVRADRPEIVLGPYLQFVAPGEAVVRYRTSKPMPTKVEFGLGSCDRTYETDEAATEHVATLTGLKRNAVHHYVVVVETEEGPARTIQYECDTHFDFTVAQEVEHRGHDAAQTSDPLAARAEALVEAIGRGTGICVLYGLIDDGALALELARRSKLRVVGIDEDPERIARARQKIVATGFYGVRISLHHVASLDSVPLTTGLANGVVVDEARRDPAEVLRLLRPSGGIALIESDDDEATAPWREFVENADPTQWAGYRWRPADGGLEVIHTGVGTSGAWSHQYGHPDNSAFSREALSGASSIDELDVQWVGRPGPRAQPDRNGRKPSPLAVNGRLFAQGLHRLIGLDAYNGSILWSLEIPQLERFNMPRDCGNWCADDEAVFVAIRDACWKIDAQSGELLAAWPPALEADQENDGHRYHWGYVARYGDKLIGSAVRETASYTTFFGGRGAGWYDAVSGPITDKVCGESLFALDPKTGRKIWGYQDGLVVQSTVTISENRAYLLECRNPDAIAADTRRVGAALWQGLWLVCLDVESGSRLWQKSVEPAIGETVVYLAKGEGQLLLVTSGQGKYRLYSYDPKDGAYQWENGFEWKKADHGAHMMRPAIVNGRIYVRPRVFDSQSGELLETTMPGGHGCGTYACTTEALIFRAANLTIWNPESGKTTRWSRLRPDCWISTVPGGGMLLSPEGGGGCSCGSWMETSVGFIPSKVLKP